MTRDSVSARRWTLLAWLCAGLLCSWLLAVPAASMADEDWSPMEAFYDQVTPEVAEGFSAVVLFQRAVIRFRNIATERNSQMDVEVRIKVLSDEGARRYGDLRIPHSRWVRLSEIEGRTIRPDGTILPLDPEQIFRERTSRASKLFLTKAAFPGVEAGSIVDYRFRMYWNDLLYLEPWLFQSEVPVLHSQVKYLIPEGMEMRFWGVETTGREMKKDLAQDPTRKVLTVWMENVPALPVEPLSLPDSVLSSRVMVIPESVSTPSGPYELMKSWDSVLDIFDDIYAKITNKDRASKKKARELTASATDAKSRTETIFRFVRDEIERQGSADVWPAIEAVDEVLESGSGSPLEIALLLRTMLEAVDVDGDLVWMANSNQVFVDPNVANPTWYEGAAVRVELNGESQFLDASGPGLALGRLAPGFDGSLGVVLGRKQAEVVDLPKRPDRETIRHLEVDLAVDGEGKASGKGQLNFRGHWAYGYIDGRETAARLDRWKSWLGDQLPEWQISEVEFTESADESHVMVSWLMARPEALVLGDEVEIVPAAFLAARQRFEATERVTPVRFRYLEGTYFDFRLTWPEGWELEAFPETVESESAAGGYFLRCDEDAEARRLSCSRMFRRSKNLYEGVEDYRLLRDLYETASRNDARSVSLLLP